MECQNCGKNEVSYVYTQNINGVKREVRLCQECARKFGLMGGDVVTDLDIDSFIEELFNTGTLRGLSNAIDQVFESSINKSIPSYEEFTNNRLFEKEGIYPGRRSIENKKPESKDDEKDKEKELSKREKLELEMKKAVEVEDYETAAKIRDELKKLKD